MHVKVLLQFAMFIIVNIQFFVKSINEPNQEYIMRGYVMPYLPVQTCAPSDLGHAYKISVRPRLKILQRIMGMTV